MQNIVAGFAESGMTRHEYCAKQNIGIATLDYWRRVERKSRPKLVEVAIETQPQASGGFALALANGRRIECSWNFIATDLKKLIRVAES
jgi:hypothetical protein